MPFSLSVFPSSLLRSRHRYVDHVNFARNGSNVSHSASYQGRIFMYVVPLAFLTVTYSDLQLTGEDSFQIATMGVQGLRVEIVSDAPPPPAEPEAPPPPPVLEMDATFALELVPGQHVALDVTVISDDDMARMEDGTTVDGQFWGYLDIVHRGDTHKLEFSGTRLPGGSEIFTPDFMFDTRTLNKLAIACKPSMAKCTLSVLAPASVYCELVLSFSPMWKIGVAFPAGEVLDEHRLKYFLRVHPGGALEHMEEQIVTTAVYYEAIPDPNAVVPHEFVAPRNSFAMPYRDFLPHLNNVLDQLGMSIHARTNFVK